MNVCILSLAFISADYVDESDLAIAECHLILEGRRGQVAEQIVYVHAWKNNAANLVALPQYECIVAIGKLWIGKVVWLEASHLILGYVGKDQLNLISLVGRQTMLPEHKFIQGGQRVSATNLAVNRRQEEPYFFKVDCWDRQAGVLQDYGNKGQHLGVEGRLSISQWEDNGQSKQKLFIVANRIELLGLKPALV